MTHQKWELFKMKSVQRKPFLPLKRLKVPLGSLEFWWNGLSAWYVCACCSGSHLARVVMMFADCLVVMEPWDVYPPGWEKIKMIFKHTFDGDMLASLGGYIYIIIYIYTLTLWQFLFWRLCVTRRCLKKLWGIVESYPMPVFGQSLEIHGWPWTLQLCLEPWGKWSTGAMAKGGRKHLRP